MSDDIKITTDEKVKDPRRVKASHKLGLISKMAKQKKDEQSKIQKRDEVTEFHGA